MRWKNHPPPEDGDVRVVKRFLLFPQCHNNEWRWLEWAWIIQRFVVDRHWTIQGWEAIGWAKSIPPKETQCNSTE